MVHQQVKKQVKVTPEEFLEGYRYIEEAMNQSDSYEDALHHILKYFDRKLNGTYSAIMIVDEKKEFFQECISNGLSEEFKEACCGTVIEKGIDSNATAIRMEKSLFQKTFRMACQGMVIKKCLIY